MTIAVVAVACVPSSEPGGAPADPAPVVRDPGEVQAPPTTPTNTAPAGSFITEGERMGIGGCQLFPTNNVFHADISSLPALPNSAAIIAAAGADLPVKPSFKSRVWQGSRGGIPINIVDSRETRMQDVNLGTYHYMSDGRNHPIPANPKVEGHPGMAWDRHMLIVDSATCTSHEFFYAQPPLPVIGTRWSAETAVKFNLSNNASRNRGSAIAAGFSMLARLVRYDEIAAGRLDHVLGISLPKISNQGEIWPAGNSDGRSSDPNAPRMGMWFRLRADVDLSGLGPDALLIARALQRHGAILGDTGPDKATIVGENDERWDDDDLATLNQLELSDFEIVDPTPMKVSDTSYEIR
ncbi:MAG: hypothetical protein ACYC2O_14065 [Microthrixaceae bacterium]